MTNLQEKSMRYCIGDEVWRWKHGMIRELKARHHDRWNRKTLLVSQGWDSGHEADAEWDSGTREAWGWECEGCGNWHRYTWDDIKYETAKNEQGEMLWDAVQDSRSHGVPDLPTRLPRHRRRAPVPFGAGFLSRTQPAPGARAQVV
jgi:hypothetical protein